MKKKILTLLLFCGLAFASSCADEILNVCTVCVEQTTQTSDEFCGGPAAVETYERTLENSSTQDWVCTRQ